MRMVVLAAVLVLMASGAQAVTLTVVSGQLMGASDVLVDGNLYDVQFLEGTCIDVFNGCDDASDLTFQTHASATLASQALLDQVFLDGVEGQFDSDPALINGCTNFSFGCDSVTPWLLHSNGTGVWVVRVHNYGLDQPFGPDLVDPLNYIYSREDSFSSWSHFAVWSPVPEPSSALLLALGLTGLAGKGRRRNPS